MNKKRQTKDTTTASLVKIAVIVAVVGIATCGYAGIGGTVSYYNDIEVSLGNFFSSSLLDLVTSNNDPRKDVSCSGDPAVFTATTTLEDGSVAVRYRVGMELGTSTDNAPDFCNALNLKAVFNGDELYDGPLMDFMVTDLTTVGTWQFSVTLPKVHAGSIADGALCDVDATFLSWQEEVPSPVKSGWDDTDRLALKLTKVGGSCEEKPPCDGSTCQSPCDTNTDTNIEVKNTDTAGIENTITTTSNTGGNIANGGQGADGGDGDDGGHIVTGNASSSVVINQTINTNSTTIVTSGNSTTTAQDIKQDIKDTVNKKIKDALAQMPHL